ncbi:MAG: PEP-CTERM sorting domain-containing protein [Rhodocyclaceae bacterium]|nr:PEP-CTERM sorting domain-containing protein [Rhodocyclaceae bacterium]
MKSRVFRVLLAAVAAFAALLPNLASAMPIDKTLNISVYQLCDDAGSNCAAKGPAENDYFADATNKIWAQAGISVTFSFVQKISSSAFLDISDTLGDNFDTLHAAYGTHGPSNTSVDMFLVRDYGNGSAYGAGWFGQGGLIMSMQSIMSFNGGLGRIDTLAHELGHNFGLVSTTDPVSNGDGHSSINNQLMAPGGTRNVPTTLADINPDGLGLDRLSPFQIDLARQSGLLSPIPEPKSYAMMLAGLGLMGLMAGRRQKRRTA